MSSETGKSSQEIKTRRLFLQDHCPTPENISEAVKREIGDVDIVSWQAEYEFIGWMSLGRDGKVSQHLTTILVNYQERGM